MATEYSKTQLKPTHALIYTQDVKIKKHSLQPNYPRSKRSNIELFSESSQRRLLFIARNSGHLIKSQICLTYHFCLPRTGKIVKKQLNSFLTLMREEYPDIVYLWVLEFQKRGVPHFHLFTSICPSNVKFRDWCATTWNRILGESQAHLLFQKHARNFIPWVMVSGKYLVKEYLAKISQKVVPEEYHEVGRFWGNSRTMKPHFTVIEPGVDCSESSFKKAVRVVTKYREKILKKWVKKNYRNKAVSYSLPNLTNLFIQSLQFFEHQEEIQYESL